MLPLTIEVPTLADLPAAAARLHAAIAGAGCPVVAVEGEMGAGKTTLISALAGVLGVADAVSSPTFGLVHEYRDRHGKPIYHFDFYRIDTPEEAARMGAGEYFDSGYLCLIEWPARVVPLLPVPRLRLTIARSGLEARQLQLALIAE